MVQSALVLSTEVSLAVPPVLAVTSWSLGRNAQPGEVILLHREQDLALSAAPVWLTWTCAGPGLLSNTKPAAAPPLPSPRTVPLTPPSSTEHLLALWRQGCSAINTFPLPSRSESSLARFAHRLSVKQKQEKRRKAEYGSAELSAFRPRSLSIEW